MSFVLEHIIKNSNIYFFLIRTAKQGVLNSFAWYGSKTSVDMTNRAFEKNPEA